MTRSPRAAAGIAALVLVAASISCAPLLSTYVAPPSSSKLHSLDAEATSTRNVNIASDNILVFDTDWPARTRNITFECPDGTQVQRSLVSDSNDSLRLSLGGTMVVLGSLLALTESGKLPGGIVVLLGATTVLSGWHPSPAALIDTAACANHETRREYNDLLKRFKALIDAGKLSVKIVDGRMVVALRSDVLFASGSSTLSQEGATSIREVAVLLAQIPEGSFQVEGHTDNVPIKITEDTSGEAKPKGAKLAPVGVAFSNWELASARAITVVKTMVDAGLPATRVSAASYGDSKPIASNDIPEGKAQNRRIEIVVVPDLSKLAGFEPPASSAP